MVTVTVTPRVTIIAAAMEVDGIIMMAIVIRRIWVMEIVTHHTNMAIGIIVYMDVDEMTMIIHREGIIQVNKLVNLRLRCALTKLMEVENAATARSVRLDKKLNAKFEQPAITHVAAVQRQRHGPRTPVWCKVKFQIPMVLRVMLLLAFSVQPHRRPSSAMVVAAVVVVRLVAMVMEVQLNDAWAVKNGPELTEEASTICKIR